MVVSGSQTYARLEQTMLAVTEIGSRTAPVDVEAAAAPGHRHLR